MEKEKLAEISIRGLNKMTKKDLRYLVRWFKSRASKLDKEAQGPWLVRRKQYASLFRFNLIER